MQGDGWLFVGIIIFIFVLWVATGGPMHPISWSGPYISPLTGPGDVGEGYGKDPAFLARYQRADSSSRPVRSDVGGLRESIADAADFGNASSHKGEVTIKHSVGGLSTNDADEEYLVITVSGRADAGVNVSGWKIESDRGSLTIGNGTNLPRSGAVNTISPILLSAGQSAVIVTGDSPIGVSFRENMCTGYFDEFQSFTPSLAQSCPAARSEYSQFYGDDTECEESIRDVDRCSVARASGNVSSSCRAFVSKYLNYNGCVAAHGSDKNFFDDEWRIYLGEDNAFFGNEHDTVRLLDTYGATVDLLSY